MTMKKINTNRSFEFFGFRKPQRPSKMKPPRPLPTSLSFLGGNVRPVLKPRLFKKERITQKHLSKWGDADLDGSPNYFDCDPRNAMKDRKKIQTIINEVSEDENNKRKKDIKAARNLERYERLRKAYQKGGLASELEVQQLVIERKKAAGRLPSKKETSKLVQLEKKVKPMTKVKGSLKELAEYKRTKVQVRRQKKIKRASKGVLTALYGSEIVAPRKMGRPKGPSGKYRDFQGKPVYEQEAQDYQAKQRALNRLLPSDIQSAPMQSIQQSMDETNQYTEQLPPEVRSSNLQSAPSAPQNRQLSEEEMNQLQLEEQQMDNVLNAPNFSRGELTNVGGPNSIMTVKGKTILEAPDMMKGQLRNLANRGKEVPAVTLGERPQTNPTGDSYVEIDPVSGKPFIVKRPSEAWMDGRAL